MFGGAGVTQHRAFVAVLLFCTAPLVACMGTFPHVGERRSHVASHQVTLEHIPDGARVVRELPNEQHKLFAADARGSIQLAFPYELSEQVENGVVTMSQARQADVTLTVQAPGHLPRRIRVAVPGPNKVDASLQRPSIAYLPNAGPDLERARILLLEGRCPDAETALAKLDDAGRAALEDMRGGCAVRAGRRVSSAASSDWDPESLEIPVDLAESPNASRRALEALMVKENDDAAIPGLLLVERMVRAGRLNEAARVAALVAAPLPAKRSALVMQLPAAMIASQRMNVALREVRNGDTRAAFEHAADALAIAPWVATKTYALVRAERIRVLTATAQEHESAREPIIARAYWVAVAALDSSSAPAAAGMARTVAPLLDEMRTRVVVQSTDAKAGHELVEELIRLVPRHVVLVEDESSRADARLLLSVAPPLRTFRSSTTHQKKSVFAFRVTKENPAFEEVQQELERAKEGIPEAREEYQRLHEASQELAHQAKAGGVAGTIAASAAISEEAAAVVILKAADNRLKNARAAFARTPRTIKEDVTRDVEFPVLHFEAEAVTKLVVRLDGFGDEINDMRQATASLVREQTPPAPEIGVEGTPSPQGELQSLTPDIAPTLAELARTLGDHVVAFESGEAEKAWAAARYQDDAFRLAAASVFYLEMLTKDSARTSEVTRHLVENLP